MRFLFEDTKNRYKDILSRMEAEKVQRAGIDLENALLGFFFPGDLNRARFSARDTLVRMLREDNREQDDGAIGRFLESIGLDVTVLDTAHGIHDQYISSRPKG